MPRIGERIVLDYGLGGQHVTTHYSCVKDIEHYLDRGDNQIRILIEADSNPEHWPS